MTNVNTTPEAIKSNMIDTLQEIWHISRRIEDKHQQCVELAGKLSTKTNYEMIWSGGMAANELTRETNVLRQLNTDLHVPVAKFSLLLSLCGLHTDDNLQGELLDWLLDGPYKHDQLGRAYLVKEGLKNYLSVAS